MPDHISQLANHCCCCIANLSGSLCDSLCCVLDAVCCLVCCLGDLVGDSLGGILEQLPSVLSGAHSSRDRNKKIKNSLAQSWLCSSDLLTVKPDS